LWRFSAKNERNMKSVTVMLKEETGFRKVFLSTFVTIFLAEIGDRTQLATLLLSAQSHSPLVVFAGSSVALVATSLIGVIIGRTLAGRLSPKDLDIAIAILLLVIAAQLLSDVVQY
jgi:putative Ca2+/H+ antiporter (TMEM165/GDT1 family)